MSPHFLTRDKSGAFVKSWLWSLVEWENETREADPKQTWPEDLVSWPSLNLRGFLPSDARPIISEFLSLLTKKNIFQYIFCLHVTIISVFHVHAMEKGIIVFHQQIFSTSWHICGWLAKAFGFYVVCLCFVLLSIYACICLSLLFRDYPFDIAV